jgi:maleylacetoacetate isomerase
LGVLQRVAKLAGDEAKAPWAIETIKKGLTTFEKAIESSKGKYSVGDHVTMADIFLIPQLYNADRFGLALDDFPKIASVRAELETLPEFIKAHADNQGDALK